MDLNEVEHLVPREKKDKRGIHLFLWLCAIGVPTMLLFLGAIWLFN